MRNLQQRALPAMMLQCESLRAGHNALEGVTRVGCMAHVERGFIKALDVVPKEQHPYALAAWLVEKIGVRLPNRKTIRRHNA